MEYYNTSILFFMKGGEKLKLGLGRLREGGYEERERGWKKAKLHAFSIWNDYLIICMLFHFYHFSNLSASCLSNLCNFLINSTSIQHTNTN